MVLKGWCDEVCEVQLQHLITVQLVQEAAGWQAPGTTKLSVLRHNKSSQKPSVADDQHSLQAIPCYYKQRP